MTKRGWRVYFECLCSDEERGIKTTDAERLKLADLCADLTTGNVFWRCASTNTSFYIPSHRSDLNVVGNNFAHG